MNDSVETNVSSMFRARADAVDIPPPPLDALRSRRVAHRRAPIAVLAAAAAVVAVAGTAGIVSLASRGNESGPSVNTAPRASVANPSATPDDAPDFQVPYVIDGVLTTSADEIPTTADRIKVGGTAVLLTDTYYASETDRESSRSSLLDGDQLVPLPALDASMPMLSPDGHHIAALSFPDGEAQLTLYQLGEELEEDGRLNLAEEGSCCGLNTVVLVGLDDGGRVYYNLGDSSFLWDGETEPRPITGAPGLIMDVGPQGALASRGELNATGTKELGDVDVNGVFSSRLAIPSEDPIEVFKWSPSGNEVAYTLESGPVVDNIADDAPAVAFNIGNRIFSHFLTFESEQTLLLIARTGNRNDILRCDVTGPCSLVRELGGPTSLDGVVFPS